MTFSKGDRVRVVKDIIHPKTSRFVDRTGTVSSSSGHWFNVRLSDSNYSKWFAWEELELLAAAGSQVVFEAPPINPPTMIQVAFPDKPLLELTKDEARTLFRQLEELI